MTDLSLTKEQIDLLRNLNALRQEVALNYIAGGYENGAKAYLDACKKLNRKPSKNPATSASEILNYPNVIEFIDSVKQVAAKSVNIDAQYVLERLYSIDQMDFMDILNDDMSFKSVSQWPKIWRQYISSFDIAEMFEHNGDEKVLVGMLKKIKWPDKVKNLELLGKHVSVKAFEKEISVQNNIHHIMPVPTANSVEDWEKASEETHEANLQNRS